MSKQKLKLSEVHMDLINSWLLVLHEQIENDVDLTVEEQEHLEAIMYGNISNYLEKFFNYPDYNNYN
jgi:hypothetical protein